MPNGTFYFDADGGPVHPQRILYLNVRPQAEALLNVILFVVDAGELAAMHAREWIYEPRVVTSELRGVSVEGGDAIMYVALPEHIVRGAAGPRQAAVRASYLRIVEAGLAQTDDAFRAEFARTTDPVPEHLVIDDRR